MAQKLGLLISAITFLTLSTLWLIVSYHLSAVLEEQVDVLGHTIATQTAASTAELVLAEDLLSLNVILSQAVQTDNIVYARIRNVNNEIISESGEGLFPTNTPLPSHLALFSAPITFQDVTAGFSDIIIDKTSMNFAIKQSIHWMAIATLALLALSVIFAMFLGRNISEPILRLTQATMAIRNGNLGFRIEEKRTDELGILIDSFNDMATGLKERDQMKNALNRYMDPKIADKVMVDAEHSFVPMGYAKATILFVDIVNFTGLCEKLTPEQVANILNVYYDVLNKSMTTFGGVIDKFIGDGAMVLFGAPKKDPEHSFNAICAASLFLELSKHLHQVAPEFQHIEYRLGLHTGELIAGSLGGQDRLQYTAVGDTVNIASRLCQLGASNYVTLSEQTHEQAFGHSRMNITQLGPCAVKGKTQQIETYRLDQLHSPHAELIQQKALYLLQQLKTKNADKASNETSYCA